LQILEFCAHVGIDFAAENNFYKNRAGPGHDCHLSPRISLPEPQWSPTIDLENNTTPLVALNPRIEDVGWHQRAIFRNSRV